MAQVATSISLRDAFKLLDVKKQSPTFTEAAPPRHTSQVCVLDCTQCKLRTKCMEHR